MQGNVVMMERFLTIVPPHMRQMLGTRAMHLAWDLYYRSCKSEASRAVAVAHACGVTRLSQTDSLLQRIVQLLGWRTLFWLRLRWSIFRGNTPRSADATRKFTPRQGASTP